MTRGTGHDFDRAFEVFSTAKLAHLGRELIDPVTIGAIRALVNAKRFVEISTYIARKEVAASPTIVATMKAYVALHQSLNREAGQFLDEAIASRQPTDTRSATDFLARTLLDAGRLSDALPLLQELFKADALNFDVGVLLNCASRLKRDEVILDTCQALYERGVREWNFVEFGSQYLEEYDPPKAINRLQEFVIANPTNRIAKLRLAIVGMRYGQNNLVQVSEEILPPPEELPMRYIVGVYSFFNGTIRVSWRSIMPIVASCPLFRTRSAQSLSWSVMAGIRPEDIPATMDKVEIGSAVQYAEGGDAPSAGSLSKTLTNRTANSKS